MFFHINVGTRNPKRKTGYKSPSVTHLNHTLSGEEAQRTLQLFVADNPEDSNTQHATDRGRTLEGRNGRCCASIEC